MKKKDYSVLKDKAFYIPIILLAIYFIIRLIDQSKITWMFPFDFTNDISSHMAKVYFLAEYGFHQLVPNWYNGYVLFKFYPPAWFYFTLPLYKIMGNVQIATYTSIILIYILGFIAINIFGKQENLSKIKRIAFFLFFFANPLAIGQLLRIGRTPELFAWLMFIPFATLIFYYKNKKIDKKFFLIILFYSLILLSHQTVFIVSNILLLSLLIIKLKNKLELFKIGLSILVTALITSFWWLPFIKDITQSNILGPKHTFAQRLLEFNSQVLVENILSFITPLMFLILFYFYWKGINKDKKELIFFSPIIIIAVLFFLRLVTIIPLLNMVYPDVYNLFFIFFSIYLFFKIKFKTKLKRHVNLILLIIISLSIIASATYTPWFVENTELDKETISILPYIEGKFFMVGYEKSYGKAFYSYAPIYYNTNTISGWSQQETNSSHLTNIKEIRNQFQQKNCEEFTNAIKKAGATEIIAYDENCEFLKNCGLKEKIKKQRVCLYSS